MPEAAEVRASIDYLKTYAIGKSIVGAGSTGAGRYKHSPPDGLERFSEMLPLKVLDVSCRGKFTWWTFENKVRMFVTYGMRGMWVPESMITQHSNFALELADANDARSALVFDDARHFGTIKFVFADADLDKKLKSLGPDPFGNEFSAERLASIVRRSSASKPICETLLDQSVFCGVGNYVRAEAMWRARVDPRRSTSDVMSSGAWSDLVDACKDVIRESYRSQSELTSWLWSVTEEGYKGAFEFSVYGRKQDAEGNSVETYDDGNGRTVHWSPLRQRR